MIKKILFDMDGTLAVFNKEASIEEVASDGYFRTLPIIHNVVRAAECLINRGYQVGILSSVFEDDHSKEDKLFWLSNHMPFLDPDNIFFSKYGKPKNTFIPKEWENAVLVDDLTANLKEWGGISIKLYNGINGTKGTWNGYSVHYRSMPHVIADQIVGIMAVVNAREHSIKC